MSSKRSLPSGAGFLPAVISKAAATPRVIRHPAQSLKGFWAPDEDPDVFEEMTLSEHLEDLRSRIVKMCLAVAVGLAGGLFASKPLLRVIQHRANIQDGFQILSPTEPFTDFMKMALYVAVVIASPIIFYQVIAFISPGMTRREKRYLLAALPFVTGLFILGAVFAFWIAAPAAFNFLSTFGGGLFKWSPQGQEVISFYQTLMIGLGLAFELPVLMLLLSKLRVLPARKQASLWRYAIVLILIAAAVITPTPDPFNMLLVASPLVVLYGIGLLLGLYL